jgi:hypothetical protein
MIRHRNANATQPVKTASLPSLRVEPDLRQAAESVLREGETLSSLIEAALREAIQRRRLNEEFLARGLRARADTQQGSATHSAAAVHAELQLRLDRRRKAVLG